MNTKGFTLRHLAFTGPGLEPAGLHFAPGLNIVYGASNTGKSFICKSIDYMLGSSRPLPDIDERRGYNGIVLGLLLPGSREVTLYRSTLGGDYLLFEGLHEERPGNITGTPLHSEHDAKSNDNLSNYLLTTLGLEGKMIARNANGEKESLSLRHLMRFLIVDETAIIDERSPILSGQYVTDTVERNVFRILLTGRDDSAVVSTMKPALRKARVTGQIDLVDEMIAGLDEELGEDHPTRAELMQQTERLGATLATHQHEMRSRQDQIDTLLVERREVFDTLNDLAARVRELDVTLRRFAKLDAVYVSDIARLEALEEGGFLLLALADRPCAACGAGPEHQAYHHGAEEIARSHQAARAEGRKIEYERRDLRHTMTSLGAEAAGLRRRIEELDVSLSRIEGELAELRPREAQGRAEYERLLSVRDKLAHQIELHRRRDRLLARRSQLDVRPARRPSTSRLAVGVDGGTGHEFARIIQELLEAWKFPGDPQVGFDLATHDIRINGKDRRANGKGVRAILHAAFKIGVLIHCRRRDLPHPGFVALDTPLLTYREPLKQTRHGPMAADELVLRASALNEHFYRSLASMQGLGQIIVLENADPPKDLLDVEVTAFTGGEGEGRFGLFPSADNQSH
ncbi:hypothetical protein [Methylobacterium soli]|uniref:Uncharacterized protein n=1 Tax=Methylobacterium soli TaxID=553447 RepID=A0A6L3T690_9HYPH|nr:hypothetical protein [Methylobacterium soli]KAB1080905.1 hypothetical protein F6X53_04255 [Methylobacterium soli]GJE44628.1 hypothetical protein AEGHOMDF_3817 [Methylobacterium soli]